MSTLPDRARLVRAVQALSKHLPEQLAGLIEAPRFDQERPVLERLADPAHALAAAQAMTEQEAGWLADVLLERWAAVATVVLPPAAAICAPAEIWLGTAPVKVAVEVAVDGLDPDWTATWEGDISGRTSGPTVMLDARPDAADHPGHAWIRVKVEGRAAGNRTLLVDHARILLRVPRLIISDDRTHVLVRDQAERPAAHVAVQIGDATQHSNAHGAVHLDATAEPGAEVRVEGIRAGRIPAD
jgi:hypothetical protein